jgi:hypothetical protein
MCCRNAGLAGLFALLLAGAPAPARAEPQGSDTSATQASKDSARAKAAHALELMDQKRWSEALDAFKEADELFHAPTLTLAMAQCERAMGHLLAARVLYQRLVDEDLATDAPDQFRKAQLTSKRELAALEARIPKVAVSVTGPGAEHARIQVDGTPLRAAELAAGRALDPGDHVIAAETDEGGSARLGFHLAEGGTSRVDLVLSPARPPTIKVVPGLEQRSTFPIAAAVLLGLGGAGLAAGAGTGIVAMTDTNDIQSRCRTIGGTLHCLASDAPERDQARTLATASIVGFAAGGAMVLAGTIVALVRTRARPASSNPAASLRAPPPDRLRLASPIEFDAGPRSLLIRGRF